MGKIIIMYENQVLGVSRSIVRELNGTLFTFQNASVSAAAAVPSPTALRASAARCMRGSSASHLD
jgi:hypothetical protein